MNRRKFVELLSAKSREELIDIINKKFEEDQRYDVVNVEFSHGFYFAYIIFEDKR